jgi:hypothetical protein
MYFAPAVLLAVGGMLAGTDAGTDATIHGSYTKAYHEATDGKRPLLVILNPPADQVAADNAISVEKLREDAEIDKLLEHYVVAEIDTGTEHGKKVHELFGSKPLPRVVVIDSTKKTQVYRTSEHLETSKIKDVLETYQDGSAASTVSSSLNWARQYVAPGNCPNCRRF